MKILSAGLERWQQLRADAVLGRRTGAPFPAPMPHSAQQAWNSSSRACQAVFQGTEILSEMTFDFRSKIEVDQKKISALSSLYDNGFGCRVNLSYPLLITLYVIYATVYPESHMV